MMPLPKSFWIQMFSTEPTMLPLEKVCEPDETEPGVRFITS